MALEPRTGSLEEEKNPELVNMTRRFWTSAVLTIPLLLIAMSVYIPKISVSSIIPFNIAEWIELILATPVVLWGGWPFFVRGTRSIINRSPNMFTLISLGVGVAYLYSLAAGVLYPFFGILLSPAIAAAAMSFSSVSVVSNALRLKESKL
jgi:Cu+-exporting ATPase